MTFPFPSNPPPSCSRRTNGLGTVNMSLPYEYVQMPSAVTDIKLELASAEMLSLQNGQVN
ncbi:hypothetical protein EON65_24140 [archaeon]|nr:MAG: hypothetical protein EON65_24140 [archaeon]